MIRVSRWLLAVFLLIGSLAVLAPAAAAPIGNDAFQRTWARTDQPVSQLHLSRTWMWGPEANTGLLSEPYQDSPGGQRTVQYFDKSRMEINDPNGDQNPLWYVTNGLLTDELITGRMSTGNVAFEQHDPAQVNVTGDPDDANAPTYATFNGLLGTSPRPTGSVITQTIDRAGNVGGNGDLGGYNVTAATFVPEKNHVVASVFWAFMNSSGLVFENGGEHDAPLFQNPFYATGFPTTEAYWTRVKIGGAEKWVLVQAFERRVLTYTPDNPDGWKVEAGNVGQHYYQWRYGQLGKTAIRSIVPDFSPFAQLWGRHGLALSVDSSGHGTMIFRVYRWCSDDPTPPCDSFSGHQIMNGGHADLVFTRVAGPTAYGNVISSNLSGVIAVGSVSLTLQPYDRAVLSQGSNTIQLCGPNFAQEAPASVMQTYPCGG